MVLQYRNGDRPKLSFRFFSLLSRCSRMKIEGEDKALISDVEKALFRAQLSLLTARRENFATRWSAASKYTAPTSASVILSKIAPKGK